MQKDKEGEANKPVTVLYEDDDVLVVNKPSGLMVHGDGRSPDATLVDWLLAHAPSAQGVGEPGYAQDGSPLERSGVVHRLDRETSGVLVLAKTQDAFWHLKTQFKERAVEKEYCAFVYGTMKENRGVIDRPIGKSARDFRLRSAQRGARGALRDAVTAWELIKQSDTHAYLKLQPKTGRTHQIRAHLKAIGRPIICDALYAPPTLRSGDNLGFTRLALHARSLTLTLPSGKGDTFIAPQPEDFKNAEVALASG